MAVLAVAVLLALCQFSTAYEHTNVNVSQPQSNFAVNRTLANYRLGGFNGGSNYLTHGFFSTDCGANISVHYTDPTVWRNERGTAQRPILILTGCVYDKRTYAQALLQVVNKIYGDVHVIYAGHDRGARTIHRAAVDNNFPDITGLGLFVADIVPFIAEYDSFSNPAAAAGYFHWSLLPKGEFATDVIMAYDGGAFVKQIFIYGQGNNPNGVELVKSGQAWEIYENFFNQLSVTNASVFDYVAGATVDYEEQQWDQGNGTKVKLPTHILYSIFNLGALFDVAEVWGDYTDPSVNLTVKGIGDQKGHFIIEEAPIDAILRLNDFMDNLGVSD